MPGDGNLTIRAGPSLATLAARGPIILADLSQVMPKGRDLTS